MALHRSEASSVLLEEVDLGRPGLGGQLAVCLHGELVELTSTGYQAPNEPMQDSTAHNVWCATKPIFHVASLHRLWDAGAAELPLGELLPNDLSAHVPEAICDLLLPELISHRIGLPRPHVMEVMHLPPEGRVGRVLESITPTDSRSRAGTYTPSKLFELAIAHTLRTEPQRLVSEWCADHLDHADEVTFNIDADDLAERCTRIGPYVFTRYAQTTYSYHDRVPSVACHDRLTAGGFVSMRALAEFYVTIATTNAVESEFVDWILGQEIIGVHDDSIGQHIDYRCGFHTQAPGVPTGTTFVGLPGLAGSSYGFAIPEAGISAAFMTNEFLQNTDDIDFFRRRMIHAICSAYTT